MSVYMSEGLTEELLKMDDTRLQGECREASILFSGIRSFSILTENMQPVDVVSLLNKYFEVMSDAVLKYKGTVDKYIGDAMMVTFGAASGLENHGWMSVQTALEMRHNLEEFNSYLVAQQKPTIQIGIGINSDQVITGNLGSSRFHQFTVIGDGVNIASSLESMSKQYGCDIVISKNTYLSCSDRLWGRELDYIHVKGRNEPVVIYEVMGLRSESIPDTRQQLLEHYIQGREHYLNRKFRRAMNEFGFIVEEMKSKDKPSLMYLKRCQYWLQNPPSEDWDGVWTLT